MYISIILIIGNHLRFYKMNKTNIISIIILGLLLLTWGGFEIYSYSVQENEKESSEFNQKDNREFDGDTSKVYYVNATIIDKLYQPANENSYEKFIMIYQNEKGDVFKIDDALKYWGSADKKDRVGVHYKYKISENFLGKTKDINFIKIEKIK